MKDAVHTKIQYWGWNKAARFYDNLWQKQLKHSQEELLKMAKVNPDEKVLDICCGSGLVTFHMAKTIQTANITGIDFSEEMIEIASNEAKKKGLKNIRFEKMNAENLSFSDAQFDVTINALGLMYLANPLNAIREMDRGLQPGGRAMVLVWGARKNCGWAEIFPIVDRRVTTETCPLFFQQGTGHTLQNSFELAGFAEIEEIRINDPIHFKNEQEAADAMLVGGPMALAWSRFSNDTKKAVRNEYLESLVPWKNGSGYYIPAEFVIVKGYRK